jgi:hypothetical protein
MSGHTEEPWIISDEDSDCITAKSREGMAEICIVETGFSEPFNSEQVANARRIVACVNACAGIPTDVIENFSATGNLFAKQGKDWLSDVQQRDELLAALKGLVDCISETRGSDANNALFYARDLIAKAEAA